MTTGLRLAGFALVLLVAFGAGYGLGDWTGGSDPEPGGAEQHQNEQVHDGPVRGLTGPMAEVAGE